MINVIAQFQRLSSIFSYSSGLARQWIHDHVSVARMLKSVSRPSLLVLVFVRLRSTGSRIFFREGTSGGVSIDTGYTLVRQTMEVRRCLHRFVSLLSVAVLPESARLALPYSPHCLPRQWIHVLPRFAELYAELHAFLHVGGPQISVRSSHSASAHYFYGPLYLHPQSFRTPMLCCPIGTNMFPEVCERMTKELTASVPSTMKIIVVAPPDENIFTVGHCAEVLLQCKDSSLGAALTSLIRTIVSSRVNTAVIEQSRLTLQSHIRSNLATV